jgi:hypothetical protein
MPNRDQVSYSARQLGLSVSYWLRGRPVPGLSHLRENDWVRNVQCPLCSGCPWRRRCSSLSTEDRPLSQRLLRRSRSRCAPRGAAAAAVNGAGFGPEGAAAFKALFVSHRSPEKCSRGRRTQCRATQRSPTTHFRNLEFKSHVLGSGCPDAQHGVPDARVCPPWSWRNL